MGQKVGSKIELTPEEAIELIKRQVAINTLKRIHDQLDNPMDSLRSMSTPDQYLLGVYSRIRTLFRGVIVLLEEDLADEALILARPLFSESLWLEHAASSSEKRHSYIISWARDSLNQAKKLFHEAHRIGIESDVEEIMASIEQQREAIDRYARRHGVRPKNFPGEKDLADTYSREDDYWCYLLAHQMIHGSEFSHLPRRLTAPGIVAYRMTGSNSAMTAGAARFAGRSMLHAQRAITRIFSDEEFAPFEELMDDLIHGTTI